MRGWRIKSVLKSLEETRKRAWEEAVAVTPSIEVVIKDGERVVMDKVTQSRSNSSEKKMATYAGYTHSIERHKEKLVLVLCDIENVIMSISDNVSKELLIERYLNFKTWESIAIDMNISGRHIYRMKNKALKRAAEAIERKGRG